jgi:hypothetical protein
MLQDAGDAEEQTGPSVLAVSAAGKAADQGLMSHPDHILLLHQWEEAPDAVAGMASAWSGTPAPRHTGNRGSWRISERLSCTTMQGRGQNPR